MKKLLISIFVFSSILYASKPQLTVNILPQKYFVEKIVKDKFDINVMIKPGSSPHNFEPKPSQMKSLNASKAYFQVGDPSEKAWIEKFKQNAKNTLFVDTTVGIEKLKMTAHSHYDEDEKAGHADEKEHEHKEEVSHKHEDAELDPHIWLDPIIVKIQAKNIYEAMIKIDEPNSAFYKTNYDEFTKELDDLDAQIKEILKPHQEKAFMVFHPSWGYYAARYNLEQVSIEFEGKEPKPNELIELINEAKKHDIKIIFVSPQFSQKSAKTIAQNINGSVVAINPLTDDWKNNLLKTTKEIASSYK